MPSRKPSSPVLDTGDDDMEPSDALALAEQAEAEAAEAEAAAAAARARARAIRLRNQASAQQTLDSDDDDTVNGSVVTEPESAEAESAEPESAEADSAEAPAEITESSAVELTTEDAEATEADDTEASENPAKRRLRRISVPALFWKVFAACVTILVICGLLGASGWMIFQHRQAEHRQQLIAEYSAAARQSVVTLMSLDFNHAQDDVNRILDNSTGEFKTDFEGQAQDFIKLAKDAKVVTEATANAAAVDTMTDNSATVLVAVNTRVTNTTGANQEPRPWRVAVNLVREGDRIKLSKVEFVP